MSNGEFPWYDIVDDNSLAQGDIVTRCPVVEPVDGYGLEDVELHIDNLSPEVDVIIADMVIMTQACDPWEPRQTGAVNHGEHRMTLRPLKNR